MSSKYVRVKDPATGHHLTVTEAQNDAFGGQVLKDHEAVDRFGRPLPPKYNQNQKQTAPVVVDQKKEG